MRLLITIPCMDQYEFARISLAQWDWQTSLSPDFLLLDNGSKCDWQKWLQTAHLKAPQRWHYLRNEENIGMVRSAQQAYEYALQGGYGLLALTHNDVWVWRNNWDHYLQILFHEKEKLGGVGFFGSKGCNKDGMRLNTFGNVLDSGHGRRMTAAWEPAVIFDGFFQCYAMELLKSLGGFDQRYQWMHIYDYDFSLSSIWAGYKNAVLNVPCHHLSGLTANNAAARTSGEDVMRANIDRFHAKWDDRLGVSVNDTDWSYTWKQGQP